MRDRAPGGNLRAWITIFLGWMALAGVAHAQSPAAPTRSRGYVEAVAQSAFGNVTSQSFGAEFGVTLRQGVLVFAEAGHVRDAAPPGFGASAQLIAGFLSQTQRGVAFSVKQPITFGLVGARYGFATMHGRLEPYLHGGAGIARVEHNASFVVDGTNVTNNLSQFGVILGTDLSGSETKPMLSLGGGLAWPAWERLVIDFQYRYGRVFTSDEALNVNRAGIGLGVRF